MVSIDEAYVHCSKHIPMLQLRRGRRGRRGRGHRRAGDVFKAKNGERAWLQRRRLRGAATAEADEPEIGTVRFAQPPGAAATRRSRSASKLDSVEAGGP